MWGACGGSGGGGGGGDGEGGGGVPCLRQCHGEGGGGGWVHDVEQAEEGAD